jgi:hypothetical protein
MKEILEGNLNNAIEEINLTATKTYEGNTHLDEKTQVWKMSDEEFEKLCSISEDEWKDDWGWWRSAKGANLGIVTNRYSINGHYITAWDGSFRKEMMEENKNISPADRYYSKRKYDNLLRYFCDEIGASTEKNVCALATDLAMQNGISMSELLKKYQG